MNVTAEQIKRIHMLKKRLVIDDEAYRAMLRNWFGVESAKKLSYSGAAQVIERLTAVLSDRQVQAQTQSQSNWGWGKSKFESLAGRDPEKFATPRQLRMLDAMWSDVSYIKDIQKRDEAFKSFLQKHFNILGIDAISQSDVGKIRLTLQTMKTSKKRDNEKTNSAM